MPGRPATARVSRARVTGRRSGIRRRRRRRARARAAPAALAPRLLLVQPLLLVLALGLPGCTGPGGPGGPGRVLPDQSGTSDTPTWSPAPTTLEAPFWVNPLSSPAQQVNRWSREGRAADAELLKLIARQPVAEWIGGDRPAVRSRSFAQAAAESGSTALLVAYNIPHRDCGQYSTGGARDAAEYRDWLDRFAEGVGDHAAVVVLEPDAVPHMVDGCTPQGYHEQRYRLLSEAVRTFKALPHTKVYLDAGHSDWIDDPAGLVGPLERAGVRQADGFALNVSNFQTTEESREYGHRISRALGGAHFVIDTSRNGRGPLTGGDQEQAWCNPPDRGLGVPPTRDTGDPLVDAYLWVKRPGDSDGECRGAPPAGRWWPDYALELARNASG